MLNILEGGSLLSIITGYNQHMLSLSSQSQLCLDELVGTMQLEVVHQEDNDV